MIDLNKRYNRQILLEEVGKYGQEKLSRAKVLVVGAGGLGCPALQYLSAAGVGTIGIVDGDYVSLSNLHRQILYTTKDVNRLKVECAKKRLQSQNPEVEVITFPFPIVGKNAKEIISQFDIVLDGTDQIHTRYMLNDACVLLDKSLVYGAIHKFEGQVSVFNYKAGPTYRDLFPTPPLPESVPTCNEVGVLGILPGMVGITQANEVLKIILGYGEVLSGKLWMYNAKNNSTQKIEFESLGESEDRAKSLEELKEVNYMGYCDAKWKM